jgi:glycosyltransferase involved in cell wall biosynthesis
VSRGVLLVGSLPPPSGGVATHLAELARALAVRNTDVRPLDVRHGRVRLLAALVGARARGDLVHLHTNGHNPKSWALALLGSGPRSVLTIHSGLAPAFMRRHRRVVGAIARRYAHVVAVNPEIAAALADAGRNDVTVCAAFTPASLQFRLAPPGLRQLRRAHRPLVACALAPGREYGAEVMLDAFARLRPRLPSVGLVCYGPGTRALAPAVHARGLDSAVALLGELDRPRALAVVAAADLFVRPTLADGDAISVREALALGRTVVASNVGARPREALTFPAGSAAALTELLFHAASNPGVARTAPVTDCLPTLLGIYRRLGLATVGTALAMW